MTQTTFYQLNQWSAEDRIMRLDFNDDNGKIDAALHALDGKSAQLDGKIAAERTYCNNKIAGVNSSLNNHSHWTKIAELSVPVVRNAKFNINIPPLGGYQMVHMDLDLKGGGFFTFKPIGTGFKVHAWLVGDMNGSLSDSLGKIDGRGIGHIVMYPCGSSSAPVSMLAYSTGNLSTGSALTESPWTPLTWGNFNNLEFYGDNAGTGEGAHISIYGMR